MIEEHAVDMSTPAGRAAWLALRRNDVTASAAACLFGAEVHPYITAFEYYCHKAGLVDEDPDDTPLYRRGRLLEPIAVELMREDRPTWRIERATSYFRDPQYRIGGTPDVFAWRPDRKGRGNCQVKSAGKWAVEKGWKSKEHGLIEPPLWVAVQASLEAYLTGCDWACVVVLALGDGGLDLYIIDVPLQRSLYAKIKDLATEFWQRVAERRPYAVDYERDADIIKALYADDDGGMTQLTGDRAAHAIKLIGEREPLKVREKDGSTAEKRRKSIDVELIDILGNHAAGMLPDGTIIQACTVRNGGSVVQPFSFRPVKILRPAHGRTTSNDRRQQSAEPDSGTF